MAQLIGNIVGAAFAVALFGTLIGWILRKTTNVTLVQSYALGIIIFSFIAPAIYVVGSDGAVSYQDAWVIYAIAGLVTFPVLYFLGRKKA